MFLFYLVLVISTLSTRTSSVIIKEVSRSIDISTQLVVIKNNITVWNQEEVSVNKFEFITEPNLNGTLVYIEATCESALKIFESRLSWKVILNSDLKPGEQTKLYVNCIYINSLVPYPSHIRQHDIQLVLFSGNIFFYSPYIVEKQITLVRLPSNRIESYTKFEPMSQFGKFLAYGPYQTVAPHSFEELKVHYENNAPFLVVVNLERNIEVSHWGNIAVEEFIELEHRGAALQGPFSRYDYQFMEQSGVSSVWKYVTALPASAKDIYYRDLIGNVSSSEVEYFDNSVHLHLRPRFPLFGGWKINYIVGYNLPSYDFLYSKGNNFLLRMKIMDYIFKSMVVEKMVTRIALPEYSVDLSMSTECAIGNFTFGKHFTYLDVIGRPTLQFTGYNLVENHIHSFDLRYVFPYKVMILEPLYLCLAIFIGFAVYIFVSHIHFEIEKKEQIVKRRKRCRYKTK